MSNFGQILPGLLRSYQQADEDGIMCIVSRQIVDEAANEIERLSGELDATVEAAVMAERRRCAELVRARTPEKQLDDDDEEVAWDEWAGGQREVCLELAILIESPQEGA